MSKQPPTFDEVAWELFEKSNILSKKTMLGISESLNTRFTVLFLAVAIAVVVPNNYIESRISCFAINTPNKEESFIELFENFCYTNGTILLFPHEPTPNTKSEWDNVSSSRKINYYQWFVVMLILQIACFKIPNRIWNYFSTMTTRMNLEEFICQVDETRKEMDALKYMERVNNAAQEIDRTLIGCKNYNNRSSLSNRVPILKNNRLTLIYIFVKLIYIVNVIGQLFFMYKFMFDYQVFPSLTFQNRPGQVDRIFPRNVFCYISNIIGENTANAYAGQCILYLNMYNQVVYSLLYYWFMFVSVITVLSVPLFIFRTVRFGARLDLIRHLLTVSKFYTNEDEPMVKKFMTNYLGCDGVFLIKKLNDNINRHVASDVLTILFNDYRNANE